MVKEELCEKVVEVRSVSHRVMTVVVFEEDVLRLQQVAEESMKVCLKRKEALSRSKWSVSINKVAAGLR